MPFQFCKPYKHFVKALCAEVDYLSVRDEFLRKSLTECSMSHQNIRVFPDSAFKISEITSMEDPSKTREKLLNFNDDYAIFHVNRFINENDLPVVINCLNKLIDKGFEIVLLPLAYTHCLRRREMLVS